MKHQQSENGPINDLDLRTGGLEFKRQAAMQTLLPIRKAGRCHQALFKVAVVFAWAFMPLLFCDIAGYPALAIKFAHLDWPLSPIVLLVMVFLCADLVGELRSMTMPAGRDWRDVDHFHFVGITALFLAFGLAVFYLVAVSSFVEPGVGRPG